jgi:Flp pilus assembly protein TadD
MAPTRSKTQRGAPSAGSYSHAREPVSLRVAHDRTVSGAVPTRARASQSGEDPRVAHRRSGLAGEVTRALAERRYADALGTILKLVMLDPCEPRWHQKYGEVLRTLGRGAEAAAAYRRAARRYEALALPARANALLRVADTLDGASPSSGASSTDRQATVPITDPVGRATRRPPT